MGIGRYVLAHAILLCAAVTLSQTAQSRDIIMLRAGDPKGPNAVFILASDAKPRRIVVRTMQIGVAGSRLDVSVDKSKTLAYSHVFTPIECKFRASGSACEIEIPQADPAYAKVLHAFERARIAHVTVMDAGVMKMDETVSLKGFTKALRG